ncbi:MAG: RNA polymerase sigma factor [Opitutales bacterium]
MQQSSLSSPQPTQAASDAARHTWIERLVEAHADALFRYASTLTNDRERARDAVQETFVRLLRQPMDTLEGREGPWLFHVCRTRVLDLARKENRMSATDFQDPVAAHAAEDAAPDAPSPAVQAEVSESAQQALSLLADLPPNQREAVRLRFQNNLSYKQIAEVTGLSVSNVGFLLHTALKTLRERMQARD